MDAVCRTSSYTLSFSFPISLSSPYLFFMPSLPSLFFAKQLAKEKSIPRTFSALLGFRTEEFQCREGSQIKSPMMAAVFGSPPCLHPHLCQSSIRAINELTQNPSQVLKEIAYFTPNITLHIPLTSFIHWLTQYFLRVISTASSMLGPRDSKMAGQVSCLSSWGLPSGRREPY